MWPSALIGVRVHQNAIAVHDGGPHLNAERPDSGKSLTQRLFQVRPFLLADLVGRRVGHHIPSDMESSICYSDD
jgi:hypothetical protein